MVKHQQADSTICKTSMSGQSGKPGKGKHKCIGIIACKLYLLSGCQLTEMSSPPSILKYINPGLETCSSDVDSAEECCIWDDNDDTGEELPNWLDSSSELGITSTRPADMHTIRGLSGAVHQLQPHTGTTVMH